MNDRLRIGDADRESAARELGEHFALGRITAEEHSERLEQIWSARTAADLSPAFRDLPRPRAAQQPSRPTTTTKQVRRDRGWEMPRVPFLFKLLLAVVAGLVGVPPPAVPAGGRDRVVRLRTAPGPPALAARSLRALGPSPLLGGLALTCC